MNHINRKNERECTKDMEDNKRQKVFEEERVYDLGYLNLVDDSVPFAEEIKNAKNRTRKRLL